MRSQNKTSCTRKRITGGGKRKKKASGRNFALAHRTRVSSLSVFLLHARISPRLSLTNKPTPVHSHTQRRDHAVLQYFSHFSRDCLVILSFCTNYNPKDELPNPDVPLFSNRDSLLQFYLINHSNALIYSHVIVPLSAFPYSSRGKKGSFMYTICFLFSLAISLPPCTCEEPLHTLNPHFFFLHVHLHVQLYVSVPKDLVGFAWEYLPLPL